MCTVIIGWKSYRHARTATAQYKVLDITNQEPRIIKGTVQKAVTAAAEIKTAIKAATEVAKAAIGIVTEIKNQSACGGTSATLSYAAAVASTGVPSDSHNMQAVNTLPVRVQHAIIVSITNAPVPAWGKAVRSRTVSQLSHRHLSQLHSGAQLPELSKGEQLGIA